jgi:hypothetical protein
VAGGEEVVAGADLVNVVTPGNASVHDWPDSLLGVDIDNQSGKKFADREHGSIVARD